MFSTNDLITELEDVIAKLLLEKKKITSELHQIEKERDELQKKFDQSLKEIKVLENKNKEIKIVSGLTGNSEHKRLMKHKLNSLIKEVDLCIADVKKKSF
jgi:chromosome segregation ATPase